MEFKVVVGAEIENIKNLYLVSLGGVRLEKKWKSPLELIKQFEGDDGTRIKVTFAFNGFLKPYIDINKHIWIVIDYEESKKE